MMYDTFGAYKRRDFDRRFTDAKDALLTGYNQFNDVLPLPDSIFLGLNRSEGIYYYFFPIA
jgi:hypothetical protein